MRPEFIFFARGEDALVSANIIDPHGQFVADSLPKLVSLADYAESRGLHFGRIEAVGKVGDAFRSLDLHDADVREAIRLGQSAKALFGGPKAKPYPSAQS